MGDEFFVNEGVRAATNRILGVDQPDIRTAEQLPALIARCRESALWAHEVGKDALERLLDEAADELERLREQRDDAADITNAMVERFAQAVGAFVETELARAHRTEARLAWVTDALKQIANEPPDRGMVPDFRKFARDALAAVEDPAE